MSQLVRERLVGGPAHADGGADPAQPAPCRSRGQHHGAVVVAVLAFGLPHQRDLSQKCSPSVFRGKVGRRGEGVVHSNPHLADGQQRACDIHVAALGGHASRPAEYLPVRGRRHEHRDDRLLQHRHRPHVQPHPALGGNAELASRHERHHALRVQVHDHLHAVLQDGARHESVEGTVQPVFLDAHGDQHARRLHRRYVDRIFPLVERRPRLGHEEAGLVAGHEHPQQGAAAGHQRHVPLGVLGALGQVDRRSGQGHARGVYAQSGPRLQTGELCGHVHEPATVSDGGAVPLDGHSTGIREAPHRPGPRRRSGHSVAVLVLDGDADADQVPDGHQAVEGGQGHRRRDLVGLGGQIGAPGSEQRDRRQSRRPRLP